MSALKDFLAFPGYYLPRKRRVWGIRCAACGQTFTFHFRVLSSCMRKMNTAVAQHRFDCPKEWGA